MSLLCFWKFPPAAGQRMGGDRVVWTDPLGDCTCLGDLHEPWRRQRRGGRAAEHREDLGERWHLIGAVEGERVLL